MKPLIFYFDSSSCSGCKACQIACKDKNNLAVGIFWRRVYEVTKGEWQPCGPACVSTVFAHNVSRACCHCEKPVCEQTCPVQAYTIREDGIVLLDSAKCIGCKDCSFACPYEAPQYDPVTDCMTKCDFCYDLIDKNQPPVCVAACPLRVLDFGYRDELEAKYGKDKLICR